MPWEAWRYPSSVQVPGILTDGCVVTMSGSRVDWGNRRVDPQFLPNMGEFDRIGQTPIRHHCPKLGQPSVGKEQSWQTTACVQAHKAALEQPFGSRRDLRLSRLRTGAPGFQVETLGHARVGRKEHVQPAPDVIPLAGCESRDRGFLWFGHGRGHIMLPVFFPTCPFAEATGRYGLPLGITTALVPAAPGVLCAEGLLAAQRRAEFSRSVIQSDADGLAEAFRTLEADAHGWLDEEEAVPATERRAAQTALMCYEGQGCELPVA
jgi:hypothetical protein